MPKTYFVKKRKSIIFDNHCKNELLTALNNKYTNGASLNINWALNLLDIINLEDSTFNLQLLTLACILDINPLVDKLVKLDARMDSPDKDNSLQIACEKGNKTAVRHLLSYGANINTKNNSCFINAIKLGHTEVVKELLSHVTNTNFLNNEAVKIAKEYGHMQIIDLLIDNSTDL